MLILILCVFDYLDITYRVLYIETRLCIFGLKLVLFLRCLNLAPLQRPSLFAPGCWSTRRPHASPR